jgi:hypothetical protein
MDASTVVAQDWRALLKLLNINTFNKIINRRKAPRQIVSN